MHTTMPDEHNCQKNEPEKARQVAHPDEADRGYSKQNSVDPVDLTPVEVSDIGA